MLSEGCITGLYFPCLYGMRVPSKGPRILEECVSKSSFSQVALLAKVLQGCILPHCTSCFGHVGVRSGNCVWSWLGACWGRGQGKAGWHSVALVWLFSCSAFLSPEFQDLGARIHLRFALHKRKHTCLLGGTYVRELCSVWRHSERWGDSGGGPHGVGGFPVGRIVSAPSSLVQM